MSVAERAKQLVRRASSFKLAAGVLVLSLMLMAYVLSGVVVAPGPARLFSDPRFRAGECAPYEVTWDTEAGRLALNASKRDALTPMMTSTLASIITSNRLALDHAVRLNQSELPVRFEVTPDYGRVRELAALLVTRGLLRVASRDSMSGVDDLLAAARVGRSLALPIGTRQPHLWDAKQRASIEYVAYKAVSSFSRSSAFTPEMARRVASSLARRSDELTPLAELVENEIAWLDAMYRHWGATNEWPRENATVFFARLWLPFLPGARRHAAEELVRLNHQYHAPLVAFLRGNGRGKAPIPIRYSGRPSSLIDKIEWGLQVVGITDPLQGMFDAQRGVDVVSRLLANRCSPDVADARPAIEQAEFEVSQLRAKCRATLH